MKLIRRFLAVAFVVVLAAVAWAWWNRPQRSEMANYAPADALVYLECNSLLDIVDGIASTDAWKGLSPSLGTGVGQLPGGWLRHFVSWTGIGPMQTVILARAQVATVMLDLGTKEQGETLTIKPEAAILLETHTAEHRIRSTVEEALRLFAEKSYRVPTLKRSDVAGSEFLVWSAPTSDRQIVATIDGSLVIVGNSERAVRMCLEVRRGQRPSLNNHPEMQQMRRHLGAEHALAFGFIPSTHAARLLSLGAPMIFGRAPGETQLDRIIGTSASKVLAGVGWSSQLSMGGIEDQYLFSLQPTLVSRLQPLFRATNAPTEALGILPNDVHSVTVYKFENPLTAWQVFATSVSAQLDTLSAVVVNSLLKSSLTQYGIEDPEKFLSMVGPEVSTARLTHDSEQSLLIAKVRDEASLRELLLGPSGRSLDRGGSRRPDLLEIPGKMIAVSFLNGNVLIGAREDLQRCLEAAAGKPAIAPEDRFEKLEHFLPSSSSACVITYARDGERALNFVRAITRAHGGSTVDRESSDLLRKVEELPYSATKTTLSDLGLERRTRSSFGQFGTLVPLLFPDR